MTITESISNTHLAEQIHACLQAGDLAGAERLCERIREISDPQPELILQLGKVHYFSKRYAEAIPLFRRVLDTFPEHSEVRIALWACYHDSGDFGQMLDIAAEFEKNPLNANELFFAYRSYLAVCDWHKAATLEQRALHSAERGELRHDLIQALLLDLCAIPDIPAEQIYRIHRLWGDAELSGKPDLCGGQPQTPAAGERLKIGYISSDFNAHPVGFFIANILHTHDRERFEIFCYAHLGRRDEVTEKLKELADHFVDITQMSHAGAAKRVHTDGIHILIDLGGHTSDTRLPVLAYRPAPLQMTYLGYPNTTGLASVDYRITDRQAECDGGTRYVEQLLYMPQSFLCYGANPGQPERQAQSAEQRELITFASFNNVRKITTQVIEAWSRILKRVPESGLMLKFKSADNPLIRNNLLDEFARHGIPADRIKLLPFIKQFNSHLTQYNEVDIALDTFPYHGTTTTCDALSMGVPVVTLAGKAHVQRVSCSILKNIGFEDTITHSIDEYVDKAVALANNRTGLAVLHQILPTLFRQSILCQPDAFTRQMETLFEQAWQEKIARPSETANSAAQMNQPEWIFITGMQRSGSTWCYNVVRELCKQHQLGTMVGFVGEGDAVDRALQNQTAENACPRIIKFHKPTEATLAMLKSGRARAIYSQRDLRDVVVSLMDFNDAPFEHVLSQRLPGLLERHHCWKRAANVQFIEYRDILGQPQAGIRQISDWLGLDCSDQQCVDIASACSTDSTRKHIEQTKRAVEGGEAANIKKVTDSRYFNAETLLHANHIQSGKIGRYRDHLSNEQIGELNAYLKEWLDEEGYEVETSSISPDNNDIQDTYMRTDTDPRTLVAGMTSMELSDDPIVIAEIGARILDPDGSGESPEIFHSISSARVLAFEADADACEQMNAIKGRVAADIRAYPYALAETPGQQTLYVTRDKMCSSLYRPNQKILDRYTGLEVAYEDMSYPIEVTSLDHFMRQEDIQSVDFIKIDVQGAELDVFRGASQAMPQLLGLCTEVEFVELYEGQPLFADVDKMLRNHGLQLHHFRETGKSPVRDADFHGKAQLLWADAVYFPSLETIDTLPAMQLLKLAVLTSLYEAYDLSQYALRRYDELAGTELMDKFASRMTAMAKGEDIIDNKPQNQPDLLQSKKTRTICIENDVRVIVPDDLNLMTPYILEEQQDWFEDEIKFVRQLIRPGMQIIDIGANYGCYALTMAKLAGPEGKLWAFEPCSSTADHLQQSIAVNNLDRIELVRAALSNRQGEATLSTQDNAELNSLTDDNGGTGTETVPLYRLDDCMQTYGWKNIDFLKLDAEGEEVRILEGGANFFRECSPLVMFELKHGATINEGLIQAFRDLGYDTYKSIPGLSMLVPFDLQEEPDPYQLNLFCCKPERAGKLQQAGLLSLEEAESELVFPDRNMLSDYLKAFPYASTLLPLWEQSEAELPGGSAYIAALSAFATAQELRGSPKSYQWLQAAFLQLIQALDEHANPARLLSLARIARDIGRRAAALQALNQFVEVINQEQRFNPVEPFLAASELAATIDPAGELANWCFAQALAERERLQAFSSYFTGANSMSVLNIIRNLNYADAEMERRRDLISRRYA